VSPDCAFTSGAAFNPAALGAGGAKAGPPSNSFDQAVVGRYVNAFVVMDQRLNWPCPINANLLDIMSIYNLRGAVITTIIVQKAPRECRLWA